jgi:rhomboid protease GluP
MSISSPPADAPPDPIPQDLVSAGTYASSRAGFEHGLVVLAMGRPFWLLPVPEGFHLLVEPDWAEAAAGQLARFDHESSGWPPPPLPTPPARRAEWTAPCLWAILLLAAFRAQLRSPGRWEEFGDLDPQQIFHHGQWWRPVTALFLHANLGHLLSNLFFGFFTFAAVLTTLGRWRGLALLILAAVAGNLAVAAINLAAPYHSLGASTGIFAGLGLLTGEAIWSTIRHGSLRIFVPLSAGGILLALYGAGGVNVDALAHLCGFAAGLVLGFASPQSSPLKSVP